MCEATPANTSKETYQYVKRDVVTFFLETQMRLMAERSVGVIDQVELNTRTRALALWVSFAMENLVYNSAPGVGVMRVCRVCEYTYDSLH